MSRNTVARGRESAAISSVDDVFRRCRAVLTVRPAALVTDIDGTISRIVPRPEDATVVEGVPASLEALRAKLDVVAVITGRDEPAARRMVGVPDLVYVSNYGVAAGDGASAGGLSRVLFELKPALAHLPCVQVEPKHTGFSLHYRNCDEPEAVRETLISLAAPAATKANARVVEGKRVVEVVPGDLPNKAAAMRRLALERGIRGLVYLGDDISDVAVFEEIARLRSTDGVDGLAIAVVDEESHPALAPGADVALGSVDEVAELLAALAAWTRGAERGPNDD
ncbi:MAG TPA: trehalose-phosphatase [Dehalococcoidia bacterium]